MNRRARLAGALVPVMLMAADARSRLPGQVLCRALVPVMLMAAGSFPAAALSDGWMPDASKAVPPAHPAKGSVHGSPFVVQKAEIRFSKAEANGYSSAILTLRQGDKFFADREFIVFLAMKPGDTPDGKTFLLRPGSPFNQPGVFKVGGVTYPPVQGIHMSWKKVKEQVPETDMTTEKTLRLQFGKRTGGVLPGTVYLCVKDKEKSFVAGSFRVVLPKS